MDDPATVSAWLAGPGREQLPSAVVAWLEAFRAKPDYAEMLAELAYARRYREAWSSAPYPPIFVTADAVVIQDGHVLLIRRKGRPGQGQWAIPGGFVEQDEFVVDAAPARAGRGDGPRCRGGGPARGHRCHPGL
jgi:bifunctional NMN adenylyltransferase/nudix hydrolase